MTDPAAAQELKCPQPGGEAVADRDKSDRCQGDTPSSGERLRDDGQAGRSGGKSPILSPETMPADPVAANTATRVAALYVETGGVYCGLEDVDPWDEERDARLYAGPWPVVAHPPCARWGQLANVNHARYGTPIGEDGGCFKAALAAVREFGGVLEHPANSIAWRHFDLPKATRGAWSQSFDDPGCVTEVSQVVYGHGARKRTWLYAVGCSWPMDWTDRPGEFVVGAGINTGECQGRRLPDSLASRTPLAFRDVLLDMARSASKVAA